jgi:hypothetical protein
VLKFLKCLMPAVSLFAVSGCALLGLLGGGSSSSGSAPAPGAAAGAAAIPPPSMFDEVEKSTPVGLMAPAALLDGNPRLEADVIGAQCKFRTADPPFFVPKTDADKGWNFVGRLNDRVDGDHEIREMDAMEYRSFLGFGWPKQQLNSWPVEMATLSEMPKVYLDQRFAMLSKIKLDEAQQKELAAQYIENSQKIEDAVRRLESTYNPEVECLSQ